LKKNLNKRPQNVTKAQKEKLLDTRKTGPVNPTHSA
jgi:hypothetical protein